ncbi:MAG TPA: folate-binding protein [Caulobacteraceae bacterium]|nr:folate-binding protein [Caulobacteraceae bacterium]
MISKLCRLNGRALVRVTGPDRRSFLQGLLTNDVETLDEGALRFAALLTPQGKFLFDLFVLAEPDALLLDVHADRRDELIRRLSRYRLRAQVGIESAEGAVSAAWGDGPLPGAADPRLQALGARLYGGAPDTTATEDDFDAHRLSLGVPDPARDCVPDRTWPIEANFDLLNGIDFRKGCFVGQETTSRMKRRGQVRNRMLPLELDGPPPPLGAEVLNGELRAGEVLSGRPGRVMALLRLDRLDGPLGVARRPARAVFPDWWPEPTPAA